MKLISSLIILMSLSLNAGVPVFSSLPLALGIGKEAYWKRVDSLNEIIKKSGIPDDLVLTIDQFEFDHAMVENDIVKYQFTYTFPSSGHEDSCSLTVNLEVKKFIVQSQKAAYKCATWED